MIDPFDQCQVHLRAWTQARGSWLLDWLILPQPLELVEGPVDNNVTALKWQHRSIRMDPSRSISITSNATSGRLSGSQAARRTPKRRGGKKEEKKKTNPIFLRENLREKKGQQRKRALNAKEGWITVEARKEVHLLRMAKNIKRSILK